MDHLARRLTTADAVVIGLGSMIGAGVFAAFGPAAAAVLPAGTAWALLGALALAAVVAWCNATSSAQLAAQYPTSGGTYVYGRERLGPWWGYVAGWGFVVGKTASCAAMALTFAAYAVPAGTPTWVERGVAAAAVVALAAVNYRGVTRTARLTRWIVAFVLAALVVTLVVLWTSGAASWGTAVRGTGVPTAGLTAELTAGLTVGGIGPDGVPTGAAGPALLGILQAAGLLFFAFAGYARVATLGEEVRDPARSIPRAIVGALGGTVILYVAVALTLLAVLGLAGTAGTTAPLATAVEQVPEASRWAGPLVRAGAAVASFGALLALIAGVGRASLAMAREGDLPRWLAAVHPRFRVPHRAEVALAAVVVLLVLTVDLRGAIGFSSFGVLVYYLVANLAAWTQTGGDRRFPRWAQALGAAGCVVLCATLPAGSVLAGLAVLAVGVLVRIGRRAPGGPANGPAGP
ncbi:amino acid permease [Xylanimonas oleitrophica]|uniref:Amino acid permease n=1 Tax=Xylanimonas oleitrophica TaxID=2607479 RepID=A0A2W5WQK9_9MICO|nr:APC family permease [Xylanimonas oleitrophica]PZR52983.1 amino acid permease [Xylanimonas oleitrophica]